MTRRAIVGAESKKIKLKFVSGENSEETKIIRSIEFSFIYACISRSTVLDILRRPFQNNDLAFAGRIAPSQSDGKFNAKNITRR